MSNTSTSTVEVYTLVGRVRGVWRGGAVQTLLGMQKAQHLFRGAYSMSGATADVTPERAELFGRSLAAALGVAPTRAGFGTLREEEILEAQKRATKVTAKSFMSVLADGPTLGPTIDGDLLLRSTNDSLQLGVGADTPLVIGTADDEISMFFSAQAKKLRWVPKRLIFGKLEIPRHAFEPYLKANSEVVAQGTARVAGRLLTDLMFRKPLVRTVALRGDEPTWVYRFAWPSGAFGFAEHCIDVPFFFDCLDSPVALEALVGPRPPQALADEVHAAAVAFIASGNPGWPRYSAAMKRTRIFHTPSSVLRDGYASVQPLLD